MKRFEQMIVTVLRCKKGNKKTQKKKNNSHSHLLRFTVLYTRS